MLTFTFGSTSTILFLALCKISLALCQTFKTFFTLLCFKYAIQCHFLSLLFMYIYVSFICPAILPVYIFTCMYFYYIYNFIVYPCFYLSMCLLLRICLKNPQCFISHSIVNSFIHFTPPPSPLVSVIICVLKAGHNSFKFPLGFYIRV